jgi:hypothetical protein
MMKPACVILLSVLGEGGGDCRVYKYMILERCKDDNLLVYLSLTHTL